jgi:hypothetical protein
MTVSSSGSSGAFAASDGIKGRKGENNMIMELPPTRRIRTGRQPKSYRRSRQ